jgi:hypothetical protein
MHGNAIGQVDTAQADISGPVAALITPAGHLVAFNYEAREFSAADSTMSTKSRNQMSTYTVHNERLDRPNILTEVTGGGSAAFSKDVVLQVLGFDFNHKRSCDMVLVKQTDGALMPTNELSHPIESSFDREMLDRFVFFHEDSHCDAMPWALTTDDSFGSESIANIQQTTVYLTQNMTGIYNHMIEGTSFGKTLSSPESYGRKLVSERYADSRGALQLAQYMLVQRGAFIEDYERVIGYVATIRDAETASYALQYQLSDHDTKDVLNETLRIVKTAHEKGAEGMVELFGEASTKLADKTSKGVWNDRTSDLALVFTQASFEVQGAQILAKYSENTSIRIDYAKGVYELGGKKPAKIDYGNPTASANAVLAARVDRAYSSLTTTSQANVNYERMN